MRHSMYARFFDIQQQFEAGFDDISTVIGVIEALFTDMYCRAMKVQGVEPMRLATRDFELVLRSVKAIQEGDVPHTAERFLSTFPDGFVLEDERAPIIAIVRCCEELYVEGRYRVLRKLVAFIAVLADVEQS